MKKKTTAALLSVAFLAALMAGCSKNEPKEDPKALAEAEVVKGIDLVSKGDYGAGMEHLLKAVELDPEHPRAWCALGTVYRDDSKDYGKAEEHYKKAVELDPQYTVCYDNLGILYTRMNRGQDAADAFRKAMSIDPGYADAHFNMGALYEATGDIEQALVEFDKYISLSKDQKKIDELKAHIDSLKQE